MGVAMNLVCLECRFVQQQDEQHSDEACDFCGSRELRSIEGVMVTVHPQIWHDGRAVTSDDVETFYVPIADAVTRSGYLPEENNDESDQLRDHRNATQRAREWSGPFYCTVDEIVGPNHDCTEHPIWQPESFQFDYGNKPLTGHIPGRCEVCSRPLRVTFEVLSVIDSVTDDVLHVEH